MLFDLKDKIIEPFGETAQQVFARISALRDSLDGPQVLLTSTCDIYLDDQNFFECFSLLS